MEPNKKYTPVSEIGLRGLVARMGSSIKNPGLAKLTGIGDDAAVLDCNKKKKLLSSALLLEGIHFNLMYHPLKHLGYKAIVAAATDVCAMNALPSHCLLNIGISNKFYVEHIDELFSGVLAACEKFGIEIGGIDFTPSLTGLAISITVSGESDEVNIATRKGAKPNDIICVTGDLGAAYMGLQVLERERKVFESTAGAQPVLAPYQYIVGRQLKPELSANTVKTLADLGVRPTSMTAITNGLAFSLFHISTQSNAGCKIFAEKVPVAEETATAAEEMGLEPLTCALNGGDDFELLFTVPVNALDKISSQKQISIIGHMVTEVKEKTLIFQSGSQVPLKSPGWPED